MVIQTVLISLMRTTVGQLPWCLCARWGSFSVPAENVCHTVVYVMDGWTVALLMGLTSKVLSSVEATPWTNQMYLTLQSVWLH